MLSTREYEEYHNEKYEDFVDHPPVVCPIGHREDCEFFVLEGGCRNCDDMEFYCNHPSLNEDEDVDVCPIEKENKENE